MKLFFSQGVTGVFWSCLLTLSTWLDYQGNSQVCVGPPKIVFVMGFRTQGYLLKDTFRMSRMKEIL